MGMTREIVRVGALVALLIGCSSGSPPMQQVDAGLDGGWQCHQEAPMACICGYEITVGEVIPSCRPGGPIQGCCLFSAILSSEYGPVGTPLCNCYQDTDCFTDTFPDAVTVASCDDQRPPRN
jgi:hypothetical protein